MEGDSAALKVSGQQAEGPEGGLNSGEEGKGGDDDGDKKCNGNRWPREETLTLLKIRSDMDSVCRDSTLKGPLWEDVSRKLEEIGYRRSAKKCKEKFEIVNKYHKRTKDGRNGKRSDAQSYKFFNEIEALENLLHPPQQCLPMIDPPITVLPPWTKMNQVHFLQSFTHNSSLQKPLNSYFPAPKSNPIENIPENSVPKTDDFLLSSLTSSSDKELGGKPKRKRKWKDYFVRMRKDVMGKQEADEILGGIGEK